jgi:hypothetical protein
MSCRRWLRRSIRRARAPFELSWQVVVVQQDPVFHRAMISLDLALRHRVIRPAADMSDAVVLEPLAELARHVGRLLACLIVAPQRGYDEPAILSYAISSFCPTSADGLHAYNARPRCKAGLHGWTGRRVGRGAHLLTGGLVTHNAGGRYP